MINENDINNIMSYYMDDLGGDYLKNQAMYEKWLAQTFFFVRHSTSLLGYALPHLKCPEIRYRFETHIAEEKKHELLIVKDLKNLGKKIEDFKENSLTSAFYHSQFYRIHFESGTSLLGYILFLEALACTWGKQLYATNKQKFSLSVSFLKVHAEEDPDHVKEALAQLELLDEKQLVEIKNNLEFSNDIYKRMILSLGATQMIKKAA